MTPNELRTAHLLGIPLICYRGHKCILEDWDEKSRTWKGKLYFLATGGSIAMLWNQDGLAAGQYFDDTFDLIGHWEEDNEQWRIFALEQGTLLKVLQENEREAS